MNQSANRLTLVLSSFLAGALMTSASLTEAIAQHDTISPAQVSETIARVRSSSASDPTLAKALLLGQSLLNEKRFAEASQLFQAILEKNPNDADALYGAALSTFNLGKPGDAEPLARSAVAATTPSGSAVVTTRQRTRAADARVLLAVVLAVRGDDPGALQNARQAVAIAPDHFDAQFTLGRAYYSAGDMASAAEAFRKAAKLRPSDDRALFFLGTALERAGNLEGALKAYRQLVEQHPQAAKGHLGLGTLLVRRGGVQLEGGILELKRAIAIEPDLYEARVTLGRTLVARGRPAESIEHLIRAAELAPSNPEPQYQLSLAYRRLRRFDKAEEATAAVRRIHEMRRSSAVPRKDPKTPDN